MGSLLKIEDLHVQYSTDDAKIYAVNGVTIEIGKGETLAIVGETGAGKTTTALSILRLLPDDVGKITKGKIIFNDMDITALSELQMKQLRGQKISMVFQDPMTSLNPTMTVGQQLEETIRIHNNKLSKSDIRSRAGEMLKLVGISENRRDDYPHQFSGGMKQRIIIAIALSCKPMLLLADEPTTALDVTIQAQVLKLIKELQKEFNTAMILITHDLGVVAQTCEKVAIMYAGKIIESGTTCDIFNGKWRHPYTEGLFSSIPDLEIRTRRLNSIDGLMPDPTNLPSGCAFYERCSRNLEICKEEAPLLYKDETHAISCHLYKAWKGGNLN